MIRNTIFKEDMVEIAGAILLFNIKEVGTF